MFTILQVTPFVDAGTAWNNSSQTDANETNTLASLGLGLRWSQGNNFTAAISWGIPLVSVDTQKNSWQENEIYFSIQYSPFFIFLVKAYLLGKPCNLRFNFLLAYSDKLVSAVFRV
ncbi:MAG: BamA/TamA family outer membrane protein [Calothrix sp. SM1_7_51]|nr:BamA/TamA family outer membrane protein [Calothrix sp. SM1_7_51]